MVVVVIAQNEQETPPLTFGAREGVVVEAIDVVVVSAHFSHHPHCYCTLFPPHEQLLMAAVGGVGGHQSVI